MDTAASLKCLETRTAVKHSQLDVLNEILVFERELLANYSKVISENAAQESKYSFNKADKEFIVKVTGIDLGVDIAPRK